MARSVVGNRATRGSDHRLIVRSIIASDDRSHDHSSCPATDHTTNRGICDLIERLVVPPFVKLCDKSRQFASSRTTERDVILRVAPPIVRWHDQLHDESCHCVIRDNPQLVV